MQGNVVSSKGRRSSILQILKENSNVSVGELSKRFGVSEVTIRKDLNLLKERNLLVRTRGGAITNDAGNAEEDMSIRFKRLAHFFAKILRLLKGKNVGKRIHFYTMRYLFKFIERLSANTLSG